MRKPEYRGDVACLGERPSIKVNEDHRLVLIFRQSFETLGIIACRLKARQLYEEARLLDSEATHTKNGRFNSGPWEGVILFIARSPIKCASASEVKNAFFFAHSRA